MIETLASLLPSGISLTAAGILVATSLLTSALTAAFGLGGGMGMLAVIANILPPIAVIPVHGIIQLGSNITRATLYRKEILWTYALWFMAGAIAGGLLGINLVMTVSQATLQFTLGLFVLYSALAPRNFRKPIGRIGQILSGVATTFATLFVGATGPLVAALLPVDHMTRQQVVGTHATLMTLQHGLKVCLFGAFGFAFAPWLWLLAAMLGMGVIGNLIGRNLHTRMSETLFRRVFQVILVLLALRLIAAALIAWW